MALGNPIGEFEFSSRGLTVSEPSSSGGGSITVDYEGTASGYGTVGSTMTFTVQEAGAKSGTVSANVARAVEEAKAGRVEYRVDKQAIVHIGIGKVSFGTEKLLQNATAFVDSLKSQKPASLKGAYVKSTNVATTMGPGIKVDAGIN